MSQAKVDRYKKEKKNRAKTLKRQKRKQIFEILACAGILGILVGYPLGKQIYKINYEKRLANNTIYASNYDYWFQTYWTGNYGDLWSTVDYDDLLASHTDATESDADNDAYIEASETDAKQ